MSPEQASVESILSDQDRSAVRTGLTTVYPESTCGIGGKSSAEAFFSRRGRLETDFARLRAVGRMIEDVYVLLYLSMCVYVCMLCMLCERSR
jgi:hypothetical protein